MLDNREIVARLIPITLTTSAIFLTIAAFARDFRDGQTLLTPMYMAVVPSSSAWCWRACAGDRARSSPASSCMR